MEVIVSAFDDHMSAVGIPENKISTEPVIQVASVDNGDDFGQHSSSDGFDSDESQTIESNMLLLEEFIQKLSIMIYEEVRDRTRQWNCPACHGGPGATPVQRFSAKRKTLGDVEVVWPPMVIIMNTGMNGMGKLDLVKYFDAYSPVKSRKCYAPHERYGMNVLIFESSADGYLMAKLLHKQFKTEERGRVHFDPLAGGLYGYLAVTKDLHIFNQTHRGKNKLKYEIRSYRQMAIEKKQLQGLKFKEQSRADALAHALDMKNKEMEIVRQRSNSQHQEYHEQLEFLERFYEDQINLARDLNIDKNILELGQFNDMKNENED
ncbi:hypothetical protein ACFE04_004621 [Oxalis oulophora]